MFIMFIFSIFAICMALFGDKVIYENDLLGVEFSVCNTDSCLRNGAVYRTSFSLFIFFLVHTLVVYCVLSFHYLFFMIKVLCLVAFVAVTFFIPGVFFDEGYVQFARVASGIFLFIQIYVLIGWAYDTNDKIAEKINAINSEEVSADRDEDEQGNKALLCLFQTLLVGGFFLFFAVCVVFWVFQFRWFVYYGRDEYGVNCSFEQAMIAINITLVLILFILPPVVQTGGSVFTSGIVGFYMTFLTYNALETSPHNECNWFADANEGNAITLWLGVLITAVAISYVGFSVSRNQVNMSDGSSAAIELAVKKDDDDEDAGVSNYDDDAEAPASSGTKDKTSLAIGGDDGMDTKSEAYISEKKANVTFHLCMAFAAVYMSMLYTAWGDNEVNDDNKARGWTSVVVNLVCVLLTALLYSWTLLAPRLCPSRFGYGDDDD